MGRINFEEIKRKNKERMNKFKVKRKPRKEKVVKENSIIKKEKTKRKKTRIWYWLLIVICIFAIIAFIGGVGFCYYIVNSAPEFDATKLYEKEATLIYDSEMNLMATLGTEKREKVTYDELPQVLVDAIIATEDSRFFQHSGFDLPRFVKASIGQLLGQSSGGASTLTMQVSKNAFTNTNSEGVQGIIRKFTDIYMSVFKIEKNYTKEEIIEFYVNSYCLGGNIYGVEQASRYYFNKSVKDLNLVEAAMIAGLFQSPNGYNPYNNPNDGNARKNTVLYLMKRHGYITDEEYKAGTSVKIADLLTEGNTAVNEYQGAIDTIVQEVIDKTGNNPYDVPMIIYSTIKRSKQDIINNFYKTYKFKDSKIEVGVGMIDNNTGAILAVGAGRNKTKAMTLNYATFDGQIKRHPGSTIKPIMDYGPAIEYENLSTYGPFIDDKTPYGGGYMRNFSGSYSGFKTMAKCLSQSINTCALQAFNMTTSDQKREFVTNLGIVIPDDITELPMSYSIGAFNGVSPVQLAAAYSAFGSGGYYTSPYSFTKLEYRDTDEVYETDVTRTRVMKASTASMITNVLVGATNSRVKVSGTKIATKTGTTSYDTQQLKKYKLTSGTIPDSWTSSYTKDYAIAIWYGYNQLDEEHVKNKWILANSHASTERFKIQAALCNKLYEKNSKFKYSGLSSASVELETIPAQKPSDYTPSNLKGTFLFVGGTEPSETSTRFSKLSDPSNVTYSLNAKSLELSWTSPGIPSAIDEAYLAEYFNDNWKILPEKYLNKRLSYNTSNIGKFGFAIYLTQGASSTYVGWTENTTYTIDMSKYSATYDGVIVKSIYSIFKSNASNGVKVTFTVAEEIKNDDFKVNVNGLTSTIALNGQYNELNQDAIASIIYKSNDIKSSVTNLSMVTTSITKENDTTWKGTPNEIPVAAGTYKITYTITFNYLNNSISKTVIQTITVS